MALRFPSFLPQGATALVCAAMVCSASRAAESGAIYAIEDRPGEIHLSDRPDALPGVVVERIAGAAPSPAVSGFEPWSNFVASAAHQQGLDPALLLAVIAVESGGQARAVSSRGAQGLMQLMPATARALGVTDPFDPKQNVDAGARHLRALLDRYHQDLARALAAYNAGATVIEHVAAGSTRWPNAETAAYVPRVLQRYAALRSPSNSPASLITAALP